MDDLRWMIWDVTLPKSWHLPGSLRFLRDSGTQFRESTAEIIGLDTRKTGFDPVNQRRIKFA